MPEGSGNSDSPYTPEHKLAVSHADNHILRLITFQPIPLCPGRTDPNCSWTSPTASRPCGRRPQRRSAFTPTRSLVGSWDVGPWLLSLIRIAIQEFPTGCDLKPFRLRCACSERMCHSESVPPHTSHVFSEALPLYTLLTHTFTSRGSNSLRKGIKKKYNPNSRVEQFFG